MKRVIAAFMLLGVMALPYSGNVLAAEKFKPFVLASQGTGDFDTRVQETRDALIAAGFEILGEYSPYSDTFVDKAHVIIITNDELKKAAGMSEHGGFAAPWRVGITQSGDEIQVMYPNPIYLANGYRLKTDLAGVTDALKQAIGAQETFGSKKGLTAHKLRKYHYTFGMEYFDDVYELAEYGSHKEAVDVLEKNLAAGVGGMTKIYRLDLGNDVTIFGVQGKFGDQNSDEHMDDTWMMKNLDFEELRKTAYLPVEIMVDGNEIIALHLRFRMALHFPDLKMMGKNSFMNLMPSPKAEGLAMEAVAGGK
ncbi:MAG TPA: hypothetical protein ENI74_02985 [Gammaproteobacteria bacterium]|nr:hypothetical protein [Gammaproteobacteria bacterium]